MKFNSLALSLAVLLSGYQYGCDGFMSPKQNHITSTTPSTTKPSSTELYIIGPMLRKMREEQAKKKMPMASEDERRDEAPGLRVGTNAWKWPPVWPYSVNDFTPKDDIVEAPQVNPMMAATGMAQPPVPPVDEKEKLNVLNYWGEEVASERTPIDEGAVDALKNHYSFYLKDGMSVLEFGAAENSYLPDGLKLDRLVGVGANKKLMEENSALTESMVVDLNNVVEEEGVDSDELRSLGAEKFDTIIMANTIDFLTQPREVFRSAWALLKPGGSMIVSFTNREAYSNLFGRAQTKMWKDMNDDQHMWICGSFFQFSASDGWEGLKGFDISPEDAKKEEGVLGAIKGIGNKKNNMFVVQATKAYVDEVIDPEDPEKSFKSKMWLLPTLEERDKQLLGSRLARVYKAYGSDNDDTDALVRNVEAAPKIYESLVKMDQFAFTFGMQAQLAADLISDPDFNGNDEQILALKMGLGLRTPSEFWELIGQRTFSMNPDEKVNLLAHIVPRFGSDDPDQEEAMQAFVAGLEPTFAVVRSKCPSMEEADVQLVGTELLASEILQPGRSTKKEFATWVASLTEEELKDVLSKRKAYKETALADMKAMQEERKKREEEIEAQRQKMIEQQKKAREERSLAFNPETGKMEIIDKKEEETKK